MRCLRIAAVTSAAVLLWTQVSAAHFLWLLTEPSGRNTSVKVFFGEGAEPDDPELLNRVVRAEVWAVGGRGEPMAVPVKIGSESLEGEIPARRQASATVLKHVYGVVKKGDAPFLLTYYAKTYSSSLPGNWNTVNDRERLPLEIVPQLDGAATVLQVLWQGQPLVGSTVTVNGPGLDSKVEGTTDEAGSFRCTLPEAGIYTIRARRVEEVKGEHEGQAYTSARAYSTLTLRNQPVKVQPIAHKLPELPKGTTSFGGAVSGDALYVYGGNYGDAHSYSSESQSGDLWKLDLKNPGKWEQLAGGSKLQGLSMVEYKGDLYRVGGFTATNKPDQDEDLRSQAEFARYSIKSGQWEMLTALPEPRSSHDAAVVSHTLYVVGGWNLQGGSRNTYWHTTACAADLSAPTIEWKKIADPPFTRRALALAEWNGRLYCIGGMSQSEGPTTAVAIYDPKSGTWSEGPALHGSGMDGFGSSAFACEGSLYVTTISGSIQRLSGDGGHWEFMGQLNHPRFFHRLLPWQGSQLVIVGGSNMSSGKVQALELLKPGAGSAVAAKE